jgi:hypothetical protein
MESQSSLTNVSGWKPDDKSPISFKSGFIYFFVTTTKLPLESTQLPRLWILGISFGAGFPNAWRFTSTTSYAIQACSLVTRTTVSSKIYNCTNCCYCESDRALLWSRKLYAFIRKITLWISFLRFLMVLLPRLLTLSRPCSRSYKLYPTTTHFRIQIQVIAALKNSS